MPELIFQDLILPEQIKKNCAEFFLVENGIAYI